MCSATTIRGVYALFHAALDFLTHQEPTLDALLGWAIKIGELNLKVMAFWMRPTPARMAIPSRPQCASPRQGQGDSGLRPRPEGPRGAPQADRGQGDQHLHSRRNASRPRLSQAEEVQASGGQLRRGLAGPAQGVRGVPRRDPDDHQLHPAAQGELQGPDLHLRRWSPGPACAHRSRQRLHAR